MKTDIIKNMKIKNEYLSPFACKDNQAIRFNKEREDIRTPFYHDIDKIIYTLAYTRYMDKTQVFTNKDNDHLQKRMTHVQFVSKIARTIGRALNLNEDLIEAIALGHDLGHVPYGHRGEYILNEISLKNGCGYFNHNIESVRVLMNIENHGIGVNMTLQVLDGIMCHNGEFLLGEYSPKNKTKEEFLYEYENSYKDKEQVKKLVPMTLEGCVVRISDMIAYLGKDIEDAIRLKIINIEDIPSNIKENLGTKNKEIVNTIILDILNNSIGKNYIKLSPKIYESIKELKEFNYKYIYDFACSTDEGNLVTLMFNTLFNRYLNDLNNNNKESSIIKDYLNNMDKSYIENNSNERIVIDYIAGMTDDFFYKQYENNL
jgi:dGTPase